MFMLEDGREHLYQWDLNRRIQIKDPTIAEVHFCNRTDDCALVVATYTDDTYDGKVYADIPNIILQQPWDIRAYAYCTDGYTKIEEVFEVKPRTKPADYVYTETEVKNYEDLKARLDEIEKNGFSEEVVAGAVEDYLDANPIEVDLTGYATEDFVNEAVKNVQVDLTGYATEDYVDKAIENIEIPEPDLTGYAKEQWVKDQGYLTEHQSLDNYATRTELNKVANSVPTKVSQLSNDKGYLTNHQDISHLATIGQVQTVEGKIPTKTSQLENDRGFLTEHQSLDGKADRYHEHSAYALKTEIPDVSKFITEVPAEYVTETELSNKGYITEHQSLEGYATEDYVDEAVKNVSVDLSGYATEKYVDDAIAQASLGGGGEAPDLTDYYTKAETEALIEAVDGCDIYFFDSTKLTFAPAEAWPNDNRAYLTEHLIEFVTRAKAGEDVVLMIYDEAMGRNTIAEFAVGDTKIELQRSLSVYDIGNESTIKRWTIIHSAEDSSKWYVKEPEDQTKHLPSMEEVEEAVAGGGSSGGSVDLTNYYTKDETYSKTEVDEAIAGIDTSGGGSGGGIQALVFTKGYQTSNIEYVTELAEIWSILKAAGSDRKAAQSQIFSKYRFFYDYCYYDGSSSELTEFIYSAGANYFEISSVPKYDSGLGGYYYCKLTAGFSGLATDTLQYINCVYTSLFPSGGGGDSWSFTTDLFSSDLYNAKEIHIMAQDLANSRICFSHVIFDGNNNETLGASHTYENFCFTTPTGADSMTPYWYYSGSEINTYDWPGDYGISLIAYKMA